jgi:hypothetical protein
MEVSRSLFCLVIQLASGIESSCEVCVLGLSCQVEEPTAGDQALINLAYYYRCGCGHGQIEQCSIKHNSQVIMQCTVEDMKFTASEVPCHACSLTSRKERARQLAERVLRNTPDSSSVSCALQYA